MRHKGCMSEGKKYQEIQHKKKYNMRRRLCEGEKNTSQGWETNMEEDDEGCEAVREEIIMQAGGALVDVWIQP